MLVPFLFLCLLLRSTPPRLIFLDTLALATDYQLPLSASTDSFMFQDGTKVPNGSYKVLLRGLKLFGDETVSEDYDSWLSPVITVNQA